MEVNVTLKAKKRAGKIYQVNATLEAFDVSAGLRFDRGQLLVVRGSFTDTYAINRRNVDSFEVYDQHTFQFLPGTKGASAYLWGTALTYGGKREWRIDYPQVVVDLYGETVSCPNRIAAVA